MKQYLLFDYGVFDDNCNGFSYYLGSFDSYVDAENYYVGHYDKLKNTNNININDQSEHGFYIWYNGILYLYIYDDQNQAIVVQQKNMPSKFTKRYLYHPIFFMNGAICYDGVLFESDDLVDCQEDCRFDIFWDFDNICDEFYGDIICVDTLLDIVTKIFIINKNDINNESDDEIEKKID